MLLLRSQVTDFRRDGFLAIDQDVFSQGELDAVQARIDVLYGNRSNLPRRRTKLAHGADPSPPLCEILGASVLDPQLTRLDVVRRCRQIAQELLGRDRVWLYFDHVFYKNSGGSSSVPWHQDSAYSATGMTSQAVHFWIPFQDVDEASGCMRYVPGSHVEGLHEHRVKHRDDGLVFRSADIDDSNAVTCPLRVGGLVCHTPLTLHGSGPNSSGAIRRAWVLQFGIGPWVALRDLGRPILTLGARLQMSAANGTAKTATGDLASVDPG